MEIQDLVSQQKIELFIHFGTNTFKLESEIDDTGNDFVFIEKVTVEDKIVDFSKGDSVDFIYNENGELYIWENVEVKLVRFHDKVYHGVRLDGKGKKYNRRSAFRLQIAEDVDIKIPTVSGPVFIPVVLQDISETGVSFISKEELQLKKDICFQMKELNLTIDLTAHIVRKIPLEDDGQYIYGCKFNKTPEQMKDFITKKQNRQLKIRAWAYVKT